MADVLTMALKEWDLQIRAMLAGRQVLLLRKGGILEADNQFELEHARFLLFPTYVHQDPRMVRSEFRAGIKSVREEPGEIEIRGYAEVAQVFEVPAIGGRAVLESLHDLHIWDAPLLDMRFAYRPEKPLYLVVVRAYALGSPVKIANTIEYAGCKSWVPLGKGVAVTNPRPALPEKKMGEITDRVAQAFAAIPA